jgi:hypothetical protein
MAAVAIPLIASVLSVIGPLLPGLIERVEALFAPKTGTTKLQTVLDALKALLEPLAAAGNLQGTPSDAELIAAIEATLALLKANGQLPLPGSALPGAAGVPVPSAPSANTMTVPVTIAWSVK